jgi:3-oxoacyl-[acyl-carrier-protein] synthase-3
MNVLIPNSATEPLNGHRASKPVLIPAGITGLGHYAPEKVLTNQDLEKIVDTNDEWIFSRTGIRQRHIAAEDESLADLCVRASQAALDDAQLTVEEIDLIIVCTCTPDYYFPSTAALVQDRLGANCAAFDLEAACSGFVYGLSVASQFIGTGAMRNVLVIGGEVMSRVVDYTDRTTCVLFGDGAGAAVVSAVPEGYGVLSVDLGANGAGGQLLKCAVRQSDTENAKVHQNGREVYKFAVHVMGESAVRALDKVGLTGADVDVFVPHQANIRIITSASERMGLPMERVFLNVERYGNTSAASIPIALSEAKAAGRLERGANVVTVGFGAGLTWASAVIKWW